MKLLSKNGASMSKRQTEAANTDPWRQNQTEISPAGTKAETKSRGHTAFAFI